MSIPQQPLHAMEFDGTARVHTPFTLPDMSAFTVAFWAKRTAAVTNNPTAIQIGVGIISDQSFQFYLHDNRYVRVYFNQTNIFGLTQPSLDPPVIQHYAVVSYSETSHELFFDGVSVGTSSASAVLNPASDHVTIGDWGTRGDQTFYGSIHDARIYNRVLTSTEITGLADPLLAPTTAIGPTDGPIFHIAGEGNLYDQSGNGNHGTGTNITYSETATHSIVNTLGYTESAGGPIPIDLSTRNDPVILDALGNPLQYGQNEVGNPHSLKHTLSHSLIS